MLTSKILEKNFLSIRIGEERSNLSLFKNKCYVYSEEFNFGTDLIIKDLSKVCSLKLEEAKKILEDINFKNNLDLDEKQILDKKYFIQSPYRKVRFKLVLDIIEARLEELFEIFYEKNINLNHFKNTNKAFYIYVDDNTLLENIKYIFTKKKFRDLQIVFNEPYEERLIAASLGAAELIGKGWEKEAIPIIQSKKSIISRLFSSLFN